MNSNMDAVKGLKIVVKSEVIHTRINETTTLRQHVFNPAQSEISAMIAKSLGLPFELIPVPDGQSGRRLENGTWTGMIGQLQREEADMVVSTLGQSEERMKVVSFSYPYTVQEVTFATTKPEYVQHLYAFVDTFSATVWMSIILCIFILTFILYIFSKKKHPHTSIFLSMVGILVRQDMLQKPEGAKGYILFASWLLGATFLSSFYSAVLLSFLSFPPIKGVKTIPELSAAVSNGERWCATYPGGYLTDIFLYSSEPALQVIGQSLEKNPGSDDIDYVLESVKPQKPVFIGGRIHFKRLKHRYFVSDDTFFSSLVSVVFRKDFCCMTKLNEIIHYLWVSGLIDKIVTDLAYRIELAKSRSIIVSNDSTERQLTLFDFGGAFIFLAVSHILSLFVFLSEILVARLKPRTFERNVQRSLNYPKY